MKFPNDYRSIWTHLYDTPFKLDWIDAGGIRTRYLEAGDPAKPTVIMIHGTAGSLENFCANISAHAADYHVIAIDMLGCGLTDKPDRPYAPRVYAPHIRDFMAAKGIAQASLIGVSLGSWVSARLALAHPAMVRSVTMVAPAGIIVSDDMKATYEGIKARRRAAAGQPSWENIRTVFEHLILEPKNRIDDIIATRWAIYQNPEMPRVMENVLAMFDADDELKPNEWQALKLPILIATAPDHIDVYQQNAEAIAGYAADVELVPVPRANHWAQFENPDVFNAASLKFLAKVWGGTE